MLAQLADILFLVDESASDITTRTQDWLRETVSELADSLQAGQIDARYGLIGFGEGLPPDGDDARFAHTQLLGPIGSKQPWTTDPADLENAIEFDLQGIGGHQSEDGWDSLEIAIAEYDFRMGAVPIVVIVQADQGRVVLNDILTRDGVIAALESKNAILNTVVVGELLQDGGPITAPRVLEDAVEGILFADATDTPLEPQPVSSWSRVFDLVEYGLNSDIYILGVQSDGADGVYDWQHDLVAFDTLNKTVVDKGDLPMTESDALQISFDGSNTGGSGMVGTGKSVLFRPNDSVPTTPDLNNGIGGQPGDANNYRAKAVEFRSRQRYLTPFPH